MNAMWQNLISSSAIKNVLDALNTMASGFSTVASHVGLLGVAFGTIVDIIGVKFILAIGKSASAIIANGVAMTAEEIAVRNLTVAKIAEAVATGAMTTAEGTNAIALASMSTAHVGLIAGIKQAVLGFLGFDVAIDSTTMALNGLKIAEVVATAGLILIPMIIGAVINSISEANTKKQEYLDTTAQTITSTKNEYDANQSLIDQYKTIKANQDGSATAKAKLVDIEEQLAKALPESATGYDAQNNKISTNIKLVETVNDAKRQTMVIDAQVLKNSMSGIDAEIAKAKEEQTAIDKIKASRKAGTDPHYTTDVKTIGTGNNTVTTETKVDNWANEDTQMKTYNDDIQKVNGSVDKYNGTIQILNEYDGQTIDNKSKINPLVDSNSTLTDINTTSTITNTNAKKDNAIAQVDVEKSMQKMADAVNTAKTSLTDINTAILEVNKGHVFTADEITDLTTKYKDLIPAVKTTTGGYTIEASALETLRTAQIKTATDIMQGEITSAEQVATSTLSRLSSYGIEIKGIKDLEDAKNAANNVVVKTPETGLTGTLATLATGMNSQLDDLEASQAKAKKAKMDGDVKAYGEAIANVDKLKASLATLTSTLNDNTLGVTGNTVSTIADTAAKEADTRATEALTVAQVALEKETIKTTAATKAYDNEMQTLSDTMKKQENQLNTLNKDGADYRKGLLAKAKLIQNEIDLTNKNIKANEANAKSLTALAAIEDKANSAKAVADANATNASNAASATTTTSSAGSSGFSSVVPTQYRSVINAAAAKYNVPANVIAGMLLTESSFQNGLTSYAGAQGIAQFIPSTAKAYGVNVNDTTSSINGMAHYMADLIKQKGNVDDAIRGYNGSGAATYTYLNTVKSNMAKTGGNSKSSAGTSTTSTSSYDKVSPAYTSPTDSGADSLLSKVASEKSALIDLQEQLSQINYEIFQSASAEFDDKVAVYSQKVSALKNDLQNTDNADSTKQKSINADILTGIQNELSMTQQKENYIKAQIKSGSYSQSQLADMNNQLLEVQTTESSITVEIKAQKEAQDALNLSILQTAQDTTANKFRTSLKRDDYKQLILNSTDDVGKTDIISDKIKQTQLLIDEENRYFTQLLTKTATTEAGKKALKDEMNNLFDTISSDEQSLIDLTSTRTSDSIALITKYLTLQQKSDEMTLKQQQTNEKNSLASSIYGGTGDADDIIKAYDKSNQTQQDAYQAQIDNLNKVNDAQTEIETRLKNQNDLIEKQTALQTAQNNKTTKLDVKNADGTWGYKMVADAATVQAAQKSVDDQIISNNDWEKSTALKHTTDALTALKTALSDEKTAKDTAYTDQLEVLQKAQDIETAKLELHYSDMDKLATDSLATLQATYGSNWDAIVGKVTDSVSAITAQLAVLNAAQAGGTLGDVVTTGTSGNTTDNANSSISGNAAALNSIRNANGIQVGNTSYNMAEARKDSEFFAEVIQAIKDNNGEYLEYDNSSQKFIDKTAKLSTGGMTPNNIDNGAMAILHSDEIISNPLETKQLLQVSSNLLALKDMPLLSTTQLADYGELVTYLPNVVTSMSDIMDKINYSNVNNNSAPVIHNSYSYGDLSFPNATDSSEILSAIKSLQSSMKQKSS